MRSVSVWQSPSPPSQRQGLSPVADCYIGDLGMAAQLPLHPPHMSRILWLKWRWLMIGKGLVGRVWLWRVELRIISLECSRRIAEDVGVAVTFQYCTSYLWCPAQPWWAGLEMLGVLLSVIPAVMWWGLGAVVVLLLVVCGYSVVLQDMRQGKTNGCLHPTKL